MSATMSFNSVAAKYDRARPGYAPEVITAMFNMAGVLAPANVLEVGCGTGQLTLPLAQAGNQILAIDPGAELIRTVMGKCAHLSVELECSTFENWGPKARQFDLVVSAQAFHWIAPELGCRKAADCMRSGGAIALLWHVTGSQETAFRKAIQPLYDLYLPPTPRYGRNGRFLRDKVDLYRSALATTLGLQPPETFVQKWSRTYSAAEYMELFSTFSFYLELAEPSRTRLYKAIEAEANRIGTVERFYETVVVVARKVTRD